MADMSEPNPKKDRKKVATTRSTSGAGFAFEDLVAADLLSRCCQSNRNSSPIGVANPFPG